MWRKQPSAPDAHLRLAFKPFSPWRIIVAWFRLVTGSLFLAEIITIIVIYPEAVFIHFTFWGIITLVLANLTFAADHIRRGHLFRSWEDPEPTFEGRCALWQVAHLSFQSACVLNHTITAYYWCILCPFVKIKSSLYLEDYGRFNRDFTYKSLGNHGLPSVLLIADWMVNDVQITWRIMPIVLAIGLSYLAVNLAVVIEQGLAYIYPTHEWKGHPWEAFAFTVLLIAILFGLVAFICWVQPHAKLRKQKESNIE